MGGRGGSSGGGALGRAEKAYDKATTNLHALKAQAKSYSRSMLEGGGGYNPHSTAVQRAEKAVSKAGEKYFSAMKAASKKG